MTDAAPHDRMQQMADYRTTCRFLARSGKQGIGFGCLFLFLGVLLLHDPLLAGLNFGLGAIELLIGLRNRYSPSAIGVVLDGIMLILLGIWNLSWQAAAIAQGIDPAWFSAVFGAAVIGVGIQRIRRYSRVKASFDDPPTEEQIAWFDEVVKEVQEASPREAGDVVEFRAGFLWKGKRFGDTAIFVDKLDMENLIVDRRDIEWTDKGKALFGGRRLVRLRIGERTFGFAEITPEMLALLESWRDEREPLDSETTATDS